MGVKWNNFVVREKGRVTFNVPVKSGDYASEVIEFGKVGSGTGEQSVQGFTALVEGAFLAGCAVEVWLPRIADGTEAAGARTLLDYSFGATLLTAVGAGNFTPAGCWTGGMIRVKSGGSAGQITISATAA